MGSFDCGDKSTFIWQKGEMWKRGWIWRLGEKEKEQGARRINK
jgi:hypothetical protein